MSYIHEALKKAQQQKDIRGLKYEGILARSIQGKRAWTGKVVGKGVVVLVILLAFVSYSWLDSGLDRDPRTREAPARVLAPRSGPGASQGDVRSLYDKAVRHHRSGEIQEAKRLYLELLKLDPGHVQTLNNLGVIYIQTRDFSSAQGALEKAIRLRPDIVDPFYNMACLYVARGEIKNSLYYLDRAVSLNPAARQWARIDRDLEPLKGSKAFQEIVAVEQPDRG